MMITSQSYSKPLQAKGFAPFLKTSFYLIQEEIKGLSNVEKVLLDTADSVMDTKKKLEFGVQLVIVFVDKIFRTWQLRNLFVRSKSKKQEPL